MEQWKEIKGYEDYQISTLGKVKTTKGKEEKIMKQRICLKGYPFVGLRRIEKGKSKSRCFRIHRLLAEAFIPNPNNLKEVDHIDRDRKNYNINNLRWCSHSQNNQNKNRQSNNKSGIIGVSWDKTNNKWTARIKTEGKYKFLGYFTDIEDAKKTRKEAEQKYFGEFAPTNN